MLKHANTLKSRLLRLTNEALCTIIMMHANATEFLMIFSVFVQRVLPSKFDNKSNIHKLSTNHTFSLFLVECEKL